MVPKTERFEMRLDPLTLERVDNWRSDQADLPSRAEAVRRLVEQGLGLGSRKQPFVLDNQQKLIVWLLTEILGQQKNYENKDTLHLIQEAIYGGHFWALQWQLTGIIHDSVDKPDAVSLVVDVLDMWWFVEHAYRKLPQSEKDRIEAEVGPWAKDPKFAGFDGNNETEYMSIARFLVEELGRFEEFKGRSFNSHHPTVARYGQMAKRFDAMRVGLGHGRSLSADQIIELLKLS